MTLAQRRLGVTAPQWAASSGRSSGVAPRRAHAQRRAPLLRTARTAAAGGAGGGSSEEPRAIGCPDLYNMSQALIAEAEATKAQVRAS